MKCEPGEEVEDGCGSPKSKVSAHLHTALALTWLAYAYFYVLRKTLGTIKSALRTELEYSEHNLASLDTAFLAAYSIGLYLSGCLVDAVSPAVVLAIGILGAAGMAALLPSALPNANNDSPFAWFPSYCCWFAHGLLQSCGHPAIQRILGRQLKGNRWSGMYLGIWTTSQTVGGIAGNLVGGTLLQISSWKAVLRGPGVVSFVVVLFLRFGYSALEVPVSNTLPFPNSSGTTTRCSPMRTLLRSFGGGSELRSVPQLHVVAFAAFFVKFVRYALLFWLPYYNYTVLGYHAAKAAYHASVFELGGFFGSMLIGPMSDRLEGPSVYRRALPSLLMLVTGAVLLGVVCPQLEDIGGNLGQSILACCIFLIGVCIDGPESVITGAMCNDLCESAGTNTVVGRVVGTVNGTGILGALLAGPAVTFWAHWFETWHAVFPLLALVSLLSALALVPLINSHTLCSRRRLVMMFIGLFSVAAFLWVSDGLHYAKHVTVIPASEAPADISI